MTKRETTTISSVKINRRDEGDMVREADPKGRVTVHNINKTQRLIDRLHRERLLDDDVYDCATILRDMYERASLLPQPRAADLSRVMGEGAEAMVDASAWHAYDTQIKSVPLKFRSVVIAVICFDEPRDLDELRAGLRYIQKYQGG